MTIKFQNAIWFILVIVVGFSACRSHKYAASKETDLSTGEGYTSCYPIQSITVSKCRLNIADGNKSYQINGSMYIRPDSVCYFRGTLVIEVLRGVIYADSFAIINRMERICYKGSNSYLSQLTGYPVNPEVLFKLFTADRCATVYQEKLGYRPTFTSDSLIVMQGGPTRNFFEITINPNDQTTKSIITYNRLRQQAGFKAVYNRYQLFHQFWLPTVFEISAQNGKNPITINAAFQEIQLNQPHTINFSIPAGYKIIELR